MSDGTVAAAPGKQKELWQLRERIAEALLKVGDFCPKCKIFAQGGIFLLKVGDFCPRWNYFAQGGKVFLSKLYQPFIRMATVINMTSPCHSQSSMILSPL